MYANGIVQKLTLTAGGNLISLFLLYTRRPLGEIGTATFNITITNIPRYPPSRLVDGGFFEVQLPQDRGEKAEERRGGQKRN